MSLRIGFIIFNPQHRIPNEKTENYRYRGTSDCRIRHSRPGRRIPLRSETRYGVSQLHFNKDIFDSDNRAGFTGGVMCEFTAPLIGVGFDLSAMYVRRNTRFLSEMDNENLSVNRDYIEIPLNLKYKLSIPAIERIIRPFVTTGPSVAFLTSRKAVNSFLKNKSCDVAWNFGFGVELFSKVQVAASYGLGLTKSLEAVGVMDNGVDIDGKNRYWTVTAAYLF